MGLSETLNFSLFTYLIVLDMKFCCTRSYSNSFYRMMRFEGLNKKACKMMTIMTTQGSWWYGQSRTALEYLLEAMKFF